MELTLKLQEIECCETAHRVVVSHEETMETAIPEYCPDIARIVDAAGQLKLREKKLSGGRLTIGGTVRVTVLYTSEESAGLRSLVLTVPFTCLIDDERLQGCRSICGSGRLQLVEARAVSARKLYVRVMPEFEVEGIACPNHRVCTDVPEDPTLQVQRQEREVQLLKCVLEREFNFNEECLPEPGKGLPEDLLLDRVSLRMTGCQRISNKLIIKGEAALSLLYRAQSQEICSYDAVLPFSQILDAADLPENGVFQANLWVVDSDVRLVRTDGGTDFGVSMRIGVSVKVFQKEKLSYITDLFSTRCEADVHSNRQIVSLPQPAQTLHQEAVQQLEFGSAKPFACVTGLECGAVSVTPEGSGAALRTNLRVKLLYLDESGAPVSTERTLELTAQAPRAPEHARAVCTPVVMQLGGSSCELRIGVDFFTEQTESLPLQSVSSVELREPEKGERPSVLLRRIEKGERLWDVAKACRADPRMIEKANHLEPDSPLPECLLLIPRIRT